MKLGILLLLIVLIFSCNRKITLQQDPLININTSNSRIKQLHELMQGTFVLHSKGVDDKLHSLNVTGTDSIVLYTTFLGDTAKGEYWLYSYEFMTSLPNNPTYTSIKRIQQIDADTYLVSYYVPPRKFNLQEVLIDNYLSREINIGLLQLRDKKVRYVYKEPNTFVGKSIVYEDKDCHCLRENIYDISPKYYQVNATFYSQKGNVKIDRKQRPNLLVRREISKNILLDIARKEYNVK